MLDRKNTLLIFSVKFMVNINGEVLQRLMEKLTLNYEHLNFAVCFYGTFLGYHLHPRNGEGANNWLIQLGVYLKILRMNVFILVLTFCKYFVNSCIQNNMKCLPILFSYMPCQFPTFTYWLQNGTENVLHCGCRFNSSSLRILCSPLFIKTFCQSALRGHLFFQKFYSTNFVQQLMYDEFSFIKFQCDIVYRRD